MKKTRYMLEFLLVALLVAADQITKYLAVHYLKGNDGISLIPDVFRFYFLEGGNSGAAFGLFQGKFWFFFVTTLIVLVGILLILIRMPREKLFMPLRITLLVLTAGAIGNYIDRIYTYVTEGYNYVIDFLYFELIDFPIFNVADCYVTVASILLLILCLFRYKEEDIDRLFAAVFKRSDKSAASAAKQESGTVAHTTEKQGNAAETLNAAETREKEAGQ